MLTDAEYAAKRDEAMLLRAELDEERWRRWQIGHPQFADVQFGALDVGFRRCYESDGSVGPCLIIGGRGRCVYCGMSDDF